MTSMLNLSDPVQKHTKKSSSKSSVSPAPKKTTSFLLSDIASPVFFKLTDLTDLMVSPHRDDHPLLQLLVSHLNMNPATLHPPAPLSSSTSSSLIQELTTLFFQTYQICFAGIESRDALSRFLNRIASTSSSSSINNDASSRSSVVAEAYFPVADDKARNIEMLMTWIQTPYFSYQPDLMDLVKRFISKDSSTRKSLSSAQLEQISAILKHAFHHVERRRLIIGDAPITAAVSLRNLSISLHPRDLAIQLSILEHKLLSAISPVHLINPASWIDPDVAPESIQAYQRWFRDLRRWMIAELLVSHRSAESRGRSIESLISTSFYLRRLRNFNGVMEILSVLCSRYIINQAKAWRFVSLKACDRFRSLAQMMSPVDDFRSLRRRLASSKPSLPYLGCVFLDLVRLHESMSMRSFTVSPPARQPLTDAPTLPARPEINEVTIDLVRYKKINDICRSFAKQCTEFPILQISTKTSFAVKDVFLPTVADLCRISPPPELPLEIDPFPLSHFFAHPPKTGHEFNFLTNLPLQASDIAEILSFVPVEQFNTGSVVFSSPDQSRSFYFILSGTVEIRLDGLANPIPIMPGTWFSFPFAQIPGTLSSVHCSATAPSSLITLSLGMIDRLGRHFLRSGFLLRFWRSVLISSLELWSLLSFKFNPRTSSPNFNLPLFHSSPSPDRFVSDSPKDRSLMSHALTSLDMKDLVKNGKRKVFANGDILVKKGESTRCFYILLSGECNIEGEGFSQTSLDVGPFALLSFFSGLPAHASVLVSSETAEFLLFDIEQIHKFCAQNREFACRFYVFCLETASFFPFASMAVPTKQAVDILFPQLWQLPQHQMLLCALNETAMYTSIPSNLSMIPEEPGKHGSESLKASTFSTKIASAKLKAAISSLHLDHPQSSSHANSSASTSAPKKSPTSSASLKSFQDMVPYLFNISYRINSRTINGLLAAIHCYPDPLHELLDLLIAPFCFSSSHGTSLNNIRCFQLISHWLTLRPTDFGPLQSCVLSQHLNQFLTECQSYFCDQQELGSSIYQAIFSHLKHQFSLVLHVSPLNAPHFCSPGSAPAGFVTPQYPRSDLSSPPLWEEVFGVRFLDLNDIAVARAIVCIDHHLLSQVTIPELFGNQYKENKNLPLSRMLDFRRNLTRWIVSSIVQGVDVDTRAALLTKFMIISKHLLALNDFNAVAGFVTALRDPDLRRLARSWEKTNLNDRKTCDDMRWVVDRQHNFKLYYSHLRNVTKQSSSFILLSEHLLQNISHLESRLKHFLSPTSMEGPDLERFEQLGGLIDILFRSQIAPYSFAREVDPVLITCLCFLDPLLETSAIHTRTQLLSTLESL